MVDRPIKKADRVASEVVEVAEVGEADVSLQNSDQNSDNISESTPEISSEPVSEQVKQTPRVAAPVKLKDRTDKKSEDQTEFNQTEPKFGDRNNGSKPKSNDRGSERSNDRSNDRGGDRNKRNSRSEEPRQPANLALLRGPKPTKPKVEEPPAEVEADTEQNTDLALEQSAE